MELCRYRCSKNEIKRRIMKSNGFAQTTARHKDIESCEKRFRSSFFSLSRERSEKEEEQQSGTDLAFLIARRRRADVDQVGGEPALPTALSVSAIAAIAILGGDGFLHRENRLGGDSS